MEEIKVVWWALLLGGLTGGVTRTLISLRIEFPYVTREPHTRQIVLVPGFVGDLLLGPIAALLLAGAAASTFQFQAAFDARGFWGPFISSIAAGIGSAQFIQERAKQNLTELERKLVKAAEELVQ